MGLNLRDFGATGDGSYADDALDAALAAAGAPTLQDIVAGELGQRAAAQLLIPRGTYRFGRGHHVSRRIVVQGEGGQAGWAATRLVFDRGVTGLIFDKNNTSLDGGDADYAALRDVGLYGNGDGTASVVVPSSSGIDVWPVNTAITPGIPPVLTRPTRDRHADPHGANAKWGVTGFHYAAVRAGLTGAATTNEPRRAPVWKANTIYAPGDIVVPPDFNGYYLVCSTGGTSDANPPSSLVLPMLWQKRFVVPAVSTLMVPVGNFGGYYYSCTSRGGAPHKTGDAEPDWTAGPDTYGDVQWTRVGLLSSLPTITDGTVHWDFGGPAWGQNFTPILTEWRATKARTIGELVTPVKNASGHGADLAYQCTAAGGSSGMTEPAWPTSHAAVTYSVGALVVFSDPDTYGYYNYNLYRCIVTGTGGGSPGFSVRDQPGTRVTETGGTPVWICDGSAIGRKYTDGTTEWTCLGPNHDRADGDKTADGATGTAVVWAARQANGVLMRAAVYIHNCDVEWFGGSGVRIAGTTVADGWRIENSWIGSNEDSGLVTEYGNSSIGACTNTMFAANGLWGVSDESEYGATYTACHAKENGSASLDGGGPFQATEESGKTGLFLGCYAEAGQADNNIEAPNSWIAGPSGPSFSTKAAQGLRLITSEDASPVTFINRKALTLLTPGPIISTSAGFEDTALTMLRFATDDAPADVRISYRSLYPTVPGRFGLRWANSESYGGMTILGGLALPKAGLVGFTFGLLVGNPAQGEERRIVVLPSAPGGSPGHGDAEYGLWQAGDIVLNANPGAGDPIGWICIVSGGWGFREGDLAFSRVWQANTAYRLGDSVEPTGIHVSTGHVYQCTKAGQTDMATEPTWTIGGPPIDDPSPAVAGGVVWKDFGLVPAVFAELAPNYPAGQRAKYANGTSVAGGADVTLAAAVAACEMIELTGALTGNIKVKLPEVKGLRRWIYNHTTGAFSLTVVTTAGGSTGVAITQGQAAWAMTDGTNVLRMSPDTTP